MASAFWCATAGLVAGLGCSSGNSVALPSGIGVPDASVDARGGSDARDEGAASDGNDGAASDAGSGIAWSPCGMLQCATVSVPLDYDDPSAGSIQIALTRSLAVPSKRIGSLFVNLGGPGGPTVSVFGGNVPSWLLAGVGTALTDQFDVIGMDMRGIGQSSPAVQCYTDAAVQAALAAPLLPQDAGQWAPVFGAAQLLQQGCEAQNDAALMSRVDTANVARDIDAVREMLGEPAITYLGYSYGTYIGAMYATLFPSHVRALALDSPVMVSSDRRQDWLVWAPALEALLGQFFAWCATASSCSPFGPEAGRTQSSIAAAYDALVAQLDASPIAAPQHVVDGAGIQLYASSSLYDPPSQWPQLGQALAAAAAGDGSQLGPAIASLVDPGNLANEKFASAYEAISALDSPLPPGFSETQLEAFLAMQIAPIGPRVGLVAATGDLPPFVGWPYTPPKPIPPISAPATPPALVTTTRYDVVPGVWATQMQAALGTGSSIVTYEGVGHVNAERVPCLGQTILAYLVSPKSPPAVTSCAAVDF